LASGKRLSTDSAARSSSGGGGGSSKATGGGQSQGGPPAGKKRKSDSTTTSGTDFDSMLLQIKTWNVEKQTKVRLSLALSPHQADRFSRIAQDDEINRLRSELTTKSSDVQRLSNEAKQLQADKQKLKGEMAARMRKALDKYVSLPPPLSTFLP
jgi:uncharacterized protein YdcH (DUF465 family)